MSLKEALLREHSKANALAITRRILAGEIAFEELWELTKNGAPPLPQRASWVLDTVTEAAPEHLQPYLPEAVRLLQQPNHNAVHRNLLKALERTALPEELQGALYDYCIDKLLNPKALPAIQAFSMSLAAKIAKGIPELEEELALVIESQMEFNSAAFKSRGRRILTLLRKS
ncbi:MAG: hypothetical protein J5I94_03955 [Phaeodactylibacter sp.]|nr:hypothetical protein [Phaeodactylibacter sp.]